MNTPLPPRLFTRDCFPDHAEGQRGRAHGNGFEVTLDTEVVVIGSGAGGAVVAAELAEAGREVVVLEEGGYHPTQSFSADPAAMVRNLYRDGGLAVALGNPPVIYSEGCCLGGSTTINGGMSWRTPEAILERWVQEHGISDASPKAMERYFTRVERFISAKHQDPHTLGRDNELLKIGADKFGWKTIPNIRNQVHCAGSNNCAFGCPTGAKQSTLVSYLPRALYFGARIYCDCRVERILSHNGRAVGVTARVVEADRRRSHRITVHAKQVVLAAGAIHTPMLLHRSGIRSASKQIGKNLTLHPNVKLIAEFDEEVEGYKGAHQFYQVREFQRQGFFMAAVNIPPSILAMTLQRYGHELGQIMQSYNRLVPAGVLCEDTVTGRVRTGPFGPPLVTYQICEHGMQRAICGLGLLAELMFAAGARRVYLPIHDMPALQSIDEARALRKQRIAKSAVELFSVHVMGTACMGADPNRHVCDPRGRVFGINGLTIADASLFPTPIGVNPMETVMALATRNAEQLLLSA